jgi:hypothetical protein
LISSTIETWSSRHQTEEELKSGISTNNLLPSEQDTITNLGMSLAVVDHRKRKSGALTQDGGNSLNMRQIHSA